MTSTSPSQSPTIFQQPKSFFLIFSIELWERFGYYGLQAIMVLYLIRGIGLSEADAVLLFSSYVALTYSFIAVGGWLGDKVLGTKRLIMLGAIVFALGYGLIAVAGDRIELIYYGLATIAVGNGLFKANPSVLLANSYPENDSRLDGAFTLYYMAINIGSLLSMIFVPIVANKYGWSLGFLMSVVGMLIALGNFILCQRVVKDIGSPPDFCPLNYWKLAATLLGIAVTIFTFTLLLQYQLILNVVMMMVTVLIILVFIKILLDLHGLERSKMLVASILILEAVMFSVLYNQMPTSLNLFALHHVTPSILGFSLHPEQFQALNPFWIMVMSPFLAMLYTRWGQQFSMSLKFAVGMCFSAAAFLILPLGIHFANPHFMISSMWLIGSYVFQALGELMISGLGLAMVAQLAPKRLMGFVMGAWFLTMSLSAVIAGKIATLTAIPTHLDASAASLELFSHIFLQIGLAAGVMALIMLATASKLTKMIKQHESSLTEPAVPYQQNV